ncbi:unnamed protein product [Effrenium voratum]|uniref:Uncharacterized protein n=1 Tax=Effrenium voratum TaxID=2562239 RepID=A0AA36I3R0_9DINO|nr:unnamed protein product [Effrenium voratum]CAJ1380503.1 unnamed protein product [Effrenium voratum]CAJ1440111.1 unnamed protein product [Effrenium voratum]
MSAVFRVARAAVSPVMGDTISCSTHCAPNCISRQPPGNDVVEEPPRKSAGRTYPVADPVDLQLNWQTIAVRHAWRKAAEMGDAGIGPPLPVKGLPEEAKAYIDPAASKKSARSANGADKVSGGDVFKI